MKVYAFVPAKGTSERLANKNMKFLNGERLYIRALKTLLKCSEIDKVFLDTESEEMYSLVDYLPIEFMKRDRSLANNTTDGHRLFMNEVYTFPDADIYIQMLCTSPFIKPETIDSAIKTIKNTSEYDSAILMKQDKCYLWENGLPTYDINNIPNSKDLPETLIESMGLYIHKKESALKLKRRYGNKPYFIFGSLEELIDVNTPEDFIYAETYAQGKKEAENKKFRMLKHFLTSAALSDLLDDMNIEKGEMCGAVLSKFTCNMKGVKLLGRANTLKLRHLEENEDFHGIYEALHSYEGISENDIICVENDMHHFAYFGDLNARLAIRAGASAAIINGNTRDMFETKQLNFPVFCKGYNSQDVRRRATLDYINKPIKFDKISIHPGDLIFADDVSVVVIYQKHESEVINRVISSLVNEKNIISDIVNNKNVNEIYQQRGAF